MKRLSHLKITSLIVMVAMAFFVLIGCTPEETVSEDIPPVDNIPAEGADVTVDESEMTDASLGIDENAQPDTMSEQSAMSSTDDDRGITMVVNNVYVDEENSLRIVVYFQSADGEDHDVTFSSDDFVLLSPDGVQNSPVMADGSLEDITISVDSSDAVELEYAALDPSETYVLQVPGFDDMTIDASASQDVNVDVPQPNPPEANPNVDVDTREDNDTNSETNTSTTGD
ncbi:hypothetical protein G4Y79_07135 [Phototrophicus methaneseepsis]|uniref:Uncharacterized protein n=1 Tax=Phototrophicus methaneseepsis TaxID=2710758 RepID=A0A7S8EC58_9CHLR|nr:hypothetical protein [Phototrophicus methaneseepsis]QPC84139.1 hypothetical protein G4Y79_07135 [Phototrophicus methaneseepsis]